VPDKSGALYLIPCPFNNLLNCTGLVLTQDNLKKDIVLAKENNIVLDKF